MSVISTKEFWKSKCHQVITRFEYGAISYDELLNSMERLGWNKSDVEDILGEDGDDDAE